MKVKFHIFNYRCGKCARVYEAPEVLQTTYGEFLLRSRGRGSEAYLNANADPVYGEVNRLLKDNAGLKNMRDIQRAAVLRKLFGIACDPDVDGSKFEIGIAPRCPYTGDEPNYWEATEPAVIVERDIPQITHHKWNALTEIEKTRLVDQAIQSLAAGDAEALSNS